MHCECGQHVHGQNAAFGRGPQVQRGTLNPIENIVHDNRVRLAFLGQLNVARKAAEDWMPSSVSRLLI
jgi:hypothetical protein